MANGYMTAAGTICIIIADASDASRAVKVMFGRMGSLGFNWCRLSSAGSLLSRGVVDPAFQNIAQPLFEGPPLLDVGLTQEPRIAKVSEGTLWDTRTALPDLTPTEAADGRRFMSGWLAALEPEARRIREACITQHATNQGRANGRNEPDAEDFAAARRLYSDSDTVILSASTPLLFANRTLGINGVVTVRQILQAPDVFMEQVLADPREWDCWGKTKLFRQRDGGIVIHSYPHGETNYYLRWEPSDITAFLDGFIYGSESINSFLHAYAEIVTRTHGLEPSDRIAVNKHAALLAGCTVPRVNKALENNIQDRAEKRAPVDPETVKLEPWERQPGMLERVAELNQDYAHVLINGNKGFVYYKTANVETGYTGWTSATVGAFSEVTSGPKFFIGPDCSRSLRDMAYCWTHHSRRRWYPGGVVLNSKATPNPNVLNLWQGFAFDPTPGDWSKTREFIQKIVCGNIEDEYEYLLDHMAWKYQNPTERTEMAKVLRGCQGIGKGFLVRQVFGPAFGPHFVSLDAPEQLVGKFNDHLASACVVFADEAFFVGDKAAAEALLTKITEPVFRVEGKFRPNYETINHMDIWIASNRDHVVPAPTGARRFVVPSFSEEKRGNTAYFAELKRELDNGERAAMLHDLLQRDLTNFDRRKVLTTPGLIEQKELDLTGFNRWWGDMLYRGAAVTLSGGAWEEWAATSALFESYQRYEDRNRTYRKMSTVDFGKSMKRFAVKPERPRSSDTQSGAPKVEPKRPPGYRVGALNVARERFDAELEVKYPWPETDPMVELQPLPTPRKEAAFAAAPPNSNSNVTPLYKKS